MNGQKTDILIFLIMVDVLTDVFNMVYFFWGGVKS